MVTNTSVIPYYSSGIRERFLLHASSPPATAKNIKYAELDYEFDDIAYQKRSLARVTTEKLTKVLPKGWPADVQGPLSWSGKDFPDETPFIYMISTEENQEIAKLGIKPESVTPELFPLPTIQRRLQSIKHEIYHGRGVAILRGLDIDHLSAEQLAVVYLGVTSYVASVRGKQDQRGSMIMHVLSRDDEDAVHNKLVEKPYHTDTSCDCLCLLTKNCAASGGRSLISSAWNVYNILARTRPDLIHTMMQPNWPFDTSGRDPPYVNRPILYFQDGKIIMNVSRRQLCGHPHYDRSAGIPGLSEAQAEALDAVHAIAREHEIKTTMQQGDIRFLNNMALLHRRETFYDDDQSQRHLMRLWLHNPKQCWRLPRTLKIAWARIFEDMERESHWDMSPAMEGGRILRTAASCD
ncbi:unnamed protein product [Clonostachys rosea]|uniref:TauD/TfdA-like domain-containing protein n=1 Tax=Bionectria ochroleuca TaxID=29856 RepID=A0ABY6USH8_BIOOC|nr:unnamed protein product [Clonostachys rosea]